MSIYSIIQLPELKDRTRYIALEIQSYFGKVNSVKEGIKLLAKGALSRLHYTEEDGMNPVIDDYAIIATYIGWLVWAGKKQKAIEWIRGLMQLSHTISFYEFYSEIQMIHPMTAELINNLYDEFV
jgi:hypothetical protein